MPFDLKRELTVSTHIFYPDSNLGLKIKKIDSETLTPFYLSFYVHSNFEKLNKYKCERVQHIHQRNVEISFKLDSRKYTNGQK